MEHRTARYWALGDEQRVQPDLAASVCDRAHGGALVVDAPLLHSSIPDPVGRGTAAFEGIFTVSSARIGRLARAARAA